MIAVSIAANNAGIGLGETSANAAADYRLMKPGQFFRQSLRKHGI
jgi:hypothetical protein